ncbi:MULTISPECIES: GlxA family transcriptional regulator [Streptomyces]|uniref:Helix-turn-helix domain-containing protein n=1 Tax=Streptomyces katrae TaxID=68223 RepID=A0ABT7GZW3_9ACTN|nr:MULTISPECIES: helix-turn-helix domain-containing protein [Streptomyces]MDK9499177.1 helix-turn-helix domain-containing protein [Streptomyces katrae]GLX18603.1 AraC family transcriptional regulator [Streptomyces lavendulae subsp. lavendulae]GLX30364.1 AraC family transcriptional regulator [Streptomyces lavendulae subsp. lavendulae]
MATVEKPHRVVVLALAGLLPFELGIPHRIFGRAKGPGERHLYEILTCGLAPGPVPTDADFTVYVEHGPELLATADTVVVPASHELGPVHSEGRLTDGLAAALAHVRPGTRMVSICTGGYVLAAAGYLDGRRATTHWAHAEHFQRMFPAVRVDADVLYTDDGDVLTSAGVAAGIDLCLHIVRRDHGAAVANDTARRTVVPPHREGGQAQFVQRPVPGPQHASTTAARAWVLDRLHEPLRLSDLARQESMSVRTFTRRFREECGVSPGEWITGQRVERARQLLERTELPVEAVARRAGFGTAQSLRKHVQAALGVSPTAYRRTFRATETAPSPSSDGPSVGAGSAH